MAPEQITGKAADHRSDVFALGVILHEMFSGTRAFRGDSTIEVLNANLKSDPSPLPSSVPPALQRITLRCLEKEPSNRFQSAADVGFALAAVLDVVISVPAARPKAAILPKWALFAVVAAILAAAGDYAIRLRVRPNVREGNSVLTRLTTDSGLTTDGAISSDGKLVAFASDRASADNLDIWVKQIGAGGPAVRLTTDAADDYDPTFSPDGTRIAFRSERNGGGIHEIPTFGGEARLLVPQGRHPRFSPDGQFLMYSTGLANRGTPSGAFAQLFVQLISGGPPVRVGASCTDIDSTAVWSPDSQHVLFEGLCDAQRAVWIFSINGNSLQPRKELYQYLSSNSFLIFPQGVAHPAFVFHEWLGQPSRLLLSGFAGGAVSIADAVSITSIPISEDAMRVTGDRQNLTFETEPEYRASAASSGRIVLSSVRTSSHVWSLPVDKAGKAKGEPVQLTAEAWSGAPSLSRDGETLAFQSRRGEGWEINSMSVRAGKQISVSAGAGRTFGQIINWKGTSISYLLNQGDHFSLWQVASSGGLPQKLLDRSFFPFDWSPDSRFLVGVGRPDVEVKILDLQTRTETTFLTDTKRELYQDHLSNDGNWVTFIAILGTHSQLYVAPFRKALVPQSEWIPITDGSGWEDKPHFSYRDNLLFFTSDRDGYRCIWAQALQPNMQPLGKPFPVYHFHQSRRSIGNLGLGALELAVGPKALVFNQQEFTGNLWLLDPSK
jgi:Tol biopolymer transport system component